MSKHLDSFSFLKTLISFKDFTHKIGGQYIFQTTPHRHSRKCKADTKIFYLINPNFHVFKKCVLPLIEFIPQLKSVGTLL